METELKDIIQKVFVSNRVDQFDMSYRANLVDGLYAIATSLEHVAIALNKLGMNGAATAGGAEWGGCEAISDGLIKIADAIEQKQP